MASSQLAQRALLLALIILGAFVPSAAARSSVVAGRGVLGASHELSRGKLQRDGKVARVSSSRVASQGCSGIHIAPSADVASVVSKEGPGTTFCFGSGTYRLSRAIVPKTNDVFQGQGQGVSLIDAGRTITPLFTSAGNYWAAPWVESLPSAGSPCRSGYPLCRDTNDVYFDGKPLVRVASKAALGAGKFFYDLPRHRLWIGSNPSGHVVEAAVLQYAWHGWFSGADNVRIDGLTIEHVGGTAVQGRASWKITNSEVRWNHVNGVIDALTINNDYFHDNGQAGFEENCQCPRSSTPHYFTGNEIAFNNGGAYAGYQTSFDASGMKFMQTGDIIVSGNYVHDNGGPGLWSDTNVINATYANNRVFHNQGPGIKDEISYAHWISNNDIEGNGDAGILIADSGPAEVSGNTLVGNSIGVEETQIDRGSGVLGPYVLRGVHVYDNVITLKAGWNGLKDWQTQRSYNNDNSWTHNFYYLDCNKNANPFIWHSGSGGYSNLSWSQWQAVGNDTTGSVNCLAGTSNLR